MTDATLGLLIMAYGTPRSLDEVAEYYTHIRHGRPPEPEALAELIERYRAIGGVSPLNEITERQVAGITERVRRRLGQPVRAYMGMKHARPFIAEAVRALVADGIRRCVALVLTPQYSAMSVEGYHRAARDELEALNADVELLTIDHWHEHPGFIAAVARRLEQTLAALPAEQRQQAMTVFTAHSLPQRLIEKGDPYAEQLQASAAAVARAAGVERWTFAYQSAGRTEVPWLGPDICAVIPELAERGCTAVVACPIGFVADHLEILYDLDIEARQVAIQHGLPFTRTPSLNDAPDFLDALADVVVARLERVQTP